MVFQDEGTAPEYYPPKGWMSLSPQKPTETDDAFLFREKRFFEEVQKGRDLLSNARAALEKRFGSRPGEGPLSAASREDFF